jgi:ribonuclease T2
VSDLLSSLRARWPTLACPTNDGIRFWGHEWEKHGTCAANVFDEHGYFQAALHLRDQHGVLRALTADGVTLTAGTTRWTRSRAPSGRAPGSSRT